MSEIINSNTSYFVDLENIPDSMLLESDQVIAEYHNNEDNVHLSLEVRGEVKVDYKDQLYCGADEFPEELKSIIRNGYYDEDGMHHTYMDHPDICVLNNNWFELFEMDDKDKCTGRTWLVDAENYTPADIDSLFMDTEADILKEKEEIER